MPFAPSSVSGCCWPAAAAAAQREGRGTPATPVSSPCQSAAEDAVEVSHAASPGVRVRSCSQAGSVSQAAPRGLLLPRWQCAAGGVLPALGTRSSSSSSSSSSHRGYASGSAAPTKLDNKLFSNAARAEEVLALVQQHAADLNYVNIATAYSRLGRACRPGGVSAQELAVQRALRLLQPLVQQQLSCFRARELAKIIHACHYLGCTDTIQQLLPVFLQQPVLAKAVAQNIANVLWAAAKSGIVLQDSQVQQLLQRLCAQLQLADPQHIANSMYAVAEMGKQLPPEQLQQLLTALCSKLDRADPQHMSNALLAVAKMGQQVPPAQLQQLLTALCSKLDRASPQECSNTLWAVAKMGQQVPLKQLQQLLDAFTKLLMATPQGVANILWACSEFRVLPSQLLTALEQQQRQLERLLSAANTQDLANMALACAWLGFGRAFLLDAVLQRAMQRLQHQTSEVADLQHRAGLWQCWTCSSMLPAWCSWLVHATSSGMTWFLVSSSSCTRHTCGCRTVSCLREAATGWGVC